VVVASVAPGRSADRSVKARAGPEDPARASSSRVQSGQSCLHPEADRVRIVHMTQPVVQEAAKGGGNQ
jgi:hypothetical protein